VVSAKGDVLRRRTPRRELGAANERRVLLAGLTFLPLSVSLSGSLSGRKNRADKLREHPRHPARNLYRVASLILVQSLLVLEYP